MYISELDVVMPVCNEGDFVVGAISAIETAADRAGLALRVIIVDDGSSDDNAAILDEIVQTHAHVQLLRQSNQGRFVARRVGLERATSEYVMLVDARVYVHPDALERIVKRVESEPERDVWNLDVELANRDSLWPAFWIGLTAIWWHEYYHNRSFVQIDADNFDKYPKGTGALFCPRSLLLKATDDFSSSFENIKLASDDTRLLRTIAKTRGINLDPAIACDYYGKDGFRNWVKQCYYRGSTFVDGYLTDTRWAIPILVAAMLGLSGGSIVVTRRPKIAAVTAAACSSLFGGLARISGATPEESKAVGYLLTPFSAFFGAGLLRGLTAVTRKRWRSR